MDNQIENDVFLTLAGKGYKKKGKNKILDNPVSIADNLAILGVGIDSNGNSTVMIENEITGKKKNIQYKGSGISTIDVEDLVDGRFLKNTSDVAELVELAKLYNIATTSARKPVIADEIMDEKLFDARMKQLKALIKESRKEVNEDEFDDDDIRVWKKLVRVVNDIIKNPDKLESLGKKYIKEFQDSELYSSPSMAEIEPLLRELMEQKGIDSFSAESSTKADAGSFEEAIMDVMDNSIGWNYALESINDTHMKKTHDLLKDIQAYVDSVEKFQKKDPSKQDIDKLNKLFDQIRKQYIHADNLISALQWFQDSHEKTGRLISELTLHSSLRD